MNQKNFIAKLILNAALFVLVFVLAGCGASGSQESKVTPVTRDQPTDIVVSTSSLAPDPEEVVKISVIKLPDGSKIILQPNSIVEVVSIPGSDVTTGETRLRITQGEILVVPNQETSKWFSVQNPSGYIARISGCAMTVSTDPVENDFGMKCVGGDCEMGTNPDLIFKVKKDEIRTYHNGIAQKPDFIKPGELEIIYGNYLPVCPLRPPTDTPQPKTTPNWATATASCKTFLSKFPGTPCP